MTVAHIDFETRSPADLPKIGAVRYTSHPETEVLCMAWSLDDTDIQVWTPSSGPFPQEVLDADEIHAHNASFERSVLNNTLGFNVYPKRMRCSASRAAQSGLPRSLERGCAALSISDGKDKEGAKLMKKMIRPDRKGRYLEDDESLARLYQYCANDVQAERALEARLPTPTHLMQRAWGVHELMNDRGIPVDVDLCQGAKRILEDAISIASEEVYNLTDGAIKTGGQVQKIKQYVNERGVNIDSLRADVLERTIPEVEDADARLILELRQAVAGAAPKKFLAILDRVSGDGRIRDNYVFPGAHTGRAASWGVQVQNFKKGKVTDEIIDAIRSGSLDRMRSQWPTVNPVVLLGQSVRAAICAPAGKVFVLADLNQIEVRLAHWLSGNKRMMELFAAGGDPYIDFAKTFFETDNVTKEQRQMAKPVVLGSNYGMGATRLASYALQLVNLELEIEEAQAVRQAYIQKYRNIPRLWRALEKTAMECVLDGKRRRLHLIHMGTERNWMYIELPSGRRLWYLDPEVVQGHKGSVLSFTNNRGYRDRTWGGTLTENLAQAITADITNDVLVRVAEAGLKPIINQHDEVGIEVDEGSAKEAAEELVRIMEQPPEWAVGLPIAAEAEIKKRWLK